MTGTHRVAIARKKSRKILASTKIAFEAVIARKKSRKILASTKTAFEAINICEDLGRLLRRGSKSNSEV